MAISGKTKVVVRRVAGDVEDAVREIFSACDVQALLNGSPDVCLKVNGIDFKPYSFTDPVVLDATLAVLKDAGAQRVQVMENCTQGNFTRLVFRRTGYEAICRRYGAEPLYLDEGRSVKVALKNFDYKVGVHERIAELIENPGAATYINLPKLKTHSMSVVTLGIKNQFGLIDQADRIRDHNDRVHQKFVDIYRLIQPDFTLIDGLHIIYNGHYPAEAHIDRCVEQADLLIGGRDTLAADVIGSAALGYSADEVPHLRIAREEGLGEGDLEKIEIDGELPKPKKPYNFDILMDFPSDLKIIRGAERCCREGCRKNTEALVQTLYKDFNGQGGFTILMGKGFAHSEIDRLEGRVHIAGDCAIEETLDRIKKLPKRGLLTISPGRNDLRANLQGLSRQMKVPIWRMTARPLEAAWLLLVAKLNKSRARVPRLF